MHRLNVRDGFLERAARLERSGEWESAGEAYAEAFWQALGARQVSRAVDALRGQARAYRLSRRYEEAKELADLSREVAERNGLFREAARAMNVLALVQHSQGDWEGAKEMYQGALDRARDIGDDELIGLACQNLGVIANILGDLREARVLYLESIGSSVRSGDKVSEMMAYNNLGIVCSDLQEWIEAEVYLGRGIEIAERIGSTPMLAKLHVNRARPLIEVGELEIARRTLERAESYGSSTEDSVVLTEAARYRGRIARLEGNYPAAAESVQQALSIAVENRLKLQHAEALEELGRLSLVQGGDARPTFVQAREIFLSLGASRDAERIDGLLAGAVSG